jgi:hypothetical protein
VADYSEFPTTPTAWQEQQLKDWQTVTPLETEDPPQPERKRRADLGALIPGIVFIVLAIVLMSGVDVSVGIFRNGGILWLALIGGGLALLVKEIRKAGRRS